MMEMNIKREIREKFKSVRKNILLKEKCKMDSNICYNIIELDEFKNASIILCYIANEIETDLRWLIDLSWEKGKIIGAPKCIDCEGLPTMEYYKIDSYNDLIEGKYGIMEPDIQNCEIINVKEKELNSVMIVPGLVYDIKGYRIGYGKGYYDRYIFQNNYKGIKIGVCYERCIIEKVRRCKYDVNVDILVSDKRIRYIKEG
jgi:5-formyltetrahydrofolate cyclo-ligase